MKAPPPVRPEPIDAACGVAQDKLRRRAGRTLSPHELVRFLDLLSQTGNFALACSTLGRSKSGLYKRRLRDSLFDSQCVAALTTFRMEDPSREREGQGVGRPPVDPCHRHGSHAVVLTTYAGRPQLRRAAPGQRLTRPSLETFLRTLAATGNVRFAARSIGVAASSIHARRRRDPAFAADMEAARDVAHASLEMNLVEASGAFSDWFLAETPRPFRGEGGLAAGEPGEGAQPSSDLTPDSALPDPSGHFITRMTVSQAINLLGRLEKRLEREDKPLLDRAYNEA